MNIREIAIESATRYFRYTTEKKRALAKHPVKEVSRDGAAYALTLHYPVASVEGMQLQVGETLYDEDDFRLLSYDRESKTLKLIPQAQLEQSLIAEPDKIFLVFDLRFLIRKVREWYDSYGHLIRLPHCTPSLRAPTITDTEICPSEDQEAAIRGIFSAPLTYVWGAPGTGKTQVVLAQSILNYVRKNKRVLITAPTNRALEQILYGILPVLEQEGIPGTLSLRMGTPTAEFARKYPEICENHALERKLQETEQQIDRYKQQIRDNETQLEQQKEYFSFLKRKEQLLSSVEIVRDRFFLLHKSEKQLSNAEELHTKLQEELPALQAALRKAEKQLRKQATKVDRKHRKTAKYERPSTNPRFLTKKEQATAQYRQEHDVYQLYLKEQEQCAQRFSQARHDLQEAETVLREAPGTIQKCKTDIRKYGEPFRPSSPFALSRPSYTTAQITVAQYAQYECRIEDKLRLYEKEEERFAAKLKSDPNTLKKETEQLRKQLQTLKSSSCELIKQHRVRLDRCKILATTLDLALLRLKPDGDFLPDHIFLDEAGYAPLIKAAPLTAFDCPLTMLGDHMQLPPVCEMNEDELSRIENASVALWTQSALYIEDLFLPSFEEFHQRFLNHQSPAFQRMPKFDLLQSYRFGDSLASILAGEVYAEALKGNARVQTELLFINAPRRPQTGSNPIKRYNPAECEAINDFIRQNKGMDIGVITPYRNQKEALKKLLPNDIEINTVHSSQGREWDCVIFSVVDTTDRFFTDSNHKISNGKKIVNTAISRAKQKLIIVCDADYWKGQKQQLIGKVVSIGEELKL